MLPKYNASNVQCFQRTMSVCLLHATRGGSALHSTKMSSSAPCPRGRTRTRPCRGATAGPEWDTRAGADWPGGPITAYKRPRNRCWASGRPAARLPSGYSSVAELGSGPRQSNSMWCSEPYTFRNLTAKLRRARCAGWTPQQMWPCLPAIRTWQPHSGPKHIMQQHG
jgi:hypothetical protein